MYHCTLVNRAEFIWSVDIFGQKRILHTFRLAMLTLVMILVTWRELSFYLFSICFNWWVFTVYICFTFLYSLSYWSNGRFDKKWKINTLKYYPFLLLSPLSLLWGFVFVAAVVFTLSLVHQSFTRVVNIKSAFFKKKYLQRLENWIQKWSVPNLYPAISETMLHTKREEVQLEQRG